MCHCHRKSCVGLLKCVVFEVCSIKFGCCVVSGGSGLAEGQGGQSLQAVWERVLYLETQGKNSQEGTENKSWAPAEISVSHTIFSMLNLVFFSRVRLQHHCRNCGEIFCNSCSDNELPLPASPKPVRVCDTCHALLLQRCSSNPTWERPTPLSRLPQTISDQTRTNADDSDSTWC